MTVPPTAAHHHSFNGWAWLKPQSAQATAKALVDGKLLSEAAFLVSVEQQPCSSSSTPETTLVLVKLPGKQSYQRCTTFSLPPLPSSLLSGKVCVWVPNFPSLPILGSLAWALGRGSPGAVEPLQPAQAVGGCHHASAPLLLLLGGDAATPCSQHGLWWWTPKFKLSSTTVHSTDLQESRLLLCPRRNPDFLPASAHPGRGEHLVPLPIGPCLSAVVNRD